MTEAPIRLVLDLAAETVPALFKSLGARAGRAMQLSQEWHDTTAGTLAADGVALQSWQDGKRSGWRLARIWPAGLQPGGSDGEAIADSRTRAMLGVVLADGIGPVARFDGRRRMARVGLCRITLVDGALLVGRRREPVCRITVEGPGPALAGLPLPGAAVATESLGAMALRRAGLLPARPLPVLPTLEPTMTVSDALAVVYAHFGERLRRLAPLTAEGAGPEPVHQMRVTVRRVRSALDRWRPEPRV